MPTTRVRRSHRLQLNRRKWSDGEEEENLKQQPGAEARSVPSNSVGVGRPVDTFLTKQLLEAGGGPLGVIAKVPR